MRRRSFHDQGDSRNGHGESGSVDWLPRSSRSRGGPRPLDFRSHGDQEAGSPLLRGGRQAPPRSPSNGRVSREGPSPRSPARKRDVFINLDKKLPDGSAPCVDRLHVDADDQVSTAASTAESSPASPTSQAALTLLKSMQRSRKGMRDKLDSRGSFDENQTAPSPASSFGASNGFRIPSNPSSRPSSRPGSGRNGSFGEPMTPSSSSTFRVKDHRPSSLERSEPRAGAMPGMKESGLLLRRRKERPHLSSLTIERTRLPCGPPAEKPQVRIRMLAEGEKIYDLYYWNEVLQETGCGGKVVVCSPKAVHGERSPLLGPGSPGLPSPGAASSSSAPDPNGTHVMKIKSKAELRKSDAEESFRKAQLKMLNLPPHMGVLPLHEVLEDDGFYYVVMEKATGGSLLSSLVEEYSDGNMPEKAMKRLMKEILSAVGHLHEQGMLHRDIKVDNLVVQVHDEPTSPSGKVRKVKLIDMDLADPDWIPHSPGKNFRAWVGTLRNSAPETFKGTFSQRSDLYSVGTVLYLLMVGRLPYDDVLFDHYDNLDEDLDGLNCEMKRTSMDWSAECWAKYPDCRDFCMWLLDFDPEKRPKSAEEAAKHRWFRDASKE